MSRLALLSCLVCCVSIFACKGAEPGADAKAEAKADGGDAKAEDKAAGEAGNADAAKADAKAEAGEAGAGTEAGAETGGGTETETGEGDESDAAPLPESFEKLDVEACDQYVADYVACIDAKVPEDQREAQRRAVFKNLEAWKQMKASGPSAATGLQIACRSAREQAKRETQAWGCEW